MDGAERMLVMNVGLVDMDRSSDDEMLEMTSDWTPLTSVPRDSSADPELICKTFTNTHWMTLSKTQGCDVRLVSILSA